MTLWLNMSSNSKGLSGKNFTEGIIKRAKKKKAEEQA